MVNLILFLISAMGLTHIIVDSAIAEKPVNWLKERLPEKILWFNPKEALDCHQCMGFWVGILCALAWGIPWVGFASVVQAPTMVGTILAVIAWLAWNVFRWFLCGCASSVACLWVSHYFTYLQARAIIDLGDMEEEITA